MSGRGASYVETLCVVAILAIVATAALPRLTGRGDIALEQAALALAADLRWLRQKSMNVPRGHAEFPQIKTGVPQLRMEYGMRSGYYIYQGGRQFRSCTFTDGVTVDGTYDSVVFNADGLANRPLTIRLNKGWRSRSVIIDRVGRIRIQ